VSAPSGHTGRWPRSGRNRVSYRVGQASGPSSGLYSGISGWWGCGSGRKPNRSVIGQVAQRVRPVSQVLGNRLRCNSGSITGQVIIVPASSP
jgi:hypothetical protein